MLLRGMLSDTESEILERSKVERYGSEDAVRIHKGYELGVIVKEYTGSFRDILDIVKKNNLNSIDGRKETSLRVSTEVNKIIEGIANKAGVSKIAVVRALLFYRERQLNSGNKECHQVKLRVCEWNINHRKGYSNNKMPSWVIDFILEQERDYDIIILMECCEKVSNWLQERKRLEERYFVFSSSNLQGGQNDVTIAVNKDTISVISTQSFFSSSHDVPDHLEVRCKCKETGKQFSVVGMRIHAGATDEEKCEELELVINSLRDVYSVIIGGDFNNNRRICPPREWNMAKLYEMCIQKGFRVLTPDGASFARDVPTDDDCCFAEDHFILKGVSCEETKYSRDFTDKDKSIYKWGKDFQTKKNWEKHGNCVSDPYPDHAILEGTITI